MKVFISWSGARSQALALELQIWLESVIQAVKPWMSSKGIDAGKQWGDEIFEQLRDAQVGIICLTPENLNSPWLLFETGALARALEFAHVIPICFGFEQLNIQHPLALLQAVRATKEGFWELAQSVNSCLSTNKLTLTTLDKSFNGQWNGLAAQLARIPPVTEQKTRPPQRTERELLEDVLAGVRALQNATRFGTNDALPMEDDDRWEEHYIRGVHLANIRGDNETNLRALKEYSLAVALMPDDIMQNTKSRLYAYRGAMFKRLRRIVEAENDVALAIKWATEKREIEDALYNMACIKAMTGNQADVVDIVRQLIERDDEWRDILAHKHYFQSLMENEEFKQLVGLN